MSGKPKEQQFVGSIPRVALLLDDSVLPAWAMRMLSEIAESGCADICLIVKRDCDAAVAKPGLGQSRPNLLHRCLHDLLAWFESKLVGKPGMLDSATSPMDASSYVARIRTIHCSTDTASATTDVIKEVRARAIDVIVNLCSDYDNPSIAAAARFGSWRCVCGKFRPTERCPPGYWEVMESLPETPSAVLVAFGDDRDEEVLYRSTSCTVGMSIADNQNTVWWKSSHFIPRLLKEIASRGADAFNQRLHHEKKLEKTAHYGVGRALRLSWLGRRLLAKLGEKIRRKWRDQYFEMQWFLLYRFADHLQTDLGLFEKLYPPNDEFWADPFVVSCEDGDFVFFETYPFARGRGHISVIKFGDDKTPEQPIDVLVEEHHLSYPFVFEYAGERYMVPESAEKNSVDLYKCVRFPDVWQFEHSLLTGRKPVDATIFEWHGRWWLFVNLSAGKNTSSWDELHVFHSDSPVSTRWTPHTQNPVVSDVRHARPAGAMFVRNGRLHRPCQDSSGHYGRGIHICEITALSETEYEQKITDSIFPDWSRSVFSTHTLNYQGCLTVSDAQRWLRRRNKRSTAS